MFLKILNAQASIFCYIMFFMNKFFNILKFSFIFITLFGLSGCSSNAEKQNYTSYKDFEDKKIATWSTSLYRDSLTNNLPDAEQVYMDVLGDMIAAMYEGKIDGFVNNDAIYPNLKKEFSNISYVVVDNSKVSHCTAFAKNDKGKVLRDKYNTFLNDIKENGKYDELVKEWIGTNEHAYIGVNEWDTSNGTLKALCGYSTPPYIYLYNNELSGFEFAIFAEFCKANNYKFEYEIGDFNSLIASLNFDMCDVCLSGFEFSQERSQEVNFSEPIYTDNAAIYFIGEDYGSPSYSSIDELSNKRIGVVEGTLFEIIANNQFSECEKSVFKSSSDAFAALQNSKVDFVLVDSLTAVQVDKNVNDLTYINENIYTQNFGFFLQKDNEKSDLLLNQLNNFIEDNRNEINSIVKKWNDGLDNAEPLDINLDTNNETIVLAITGNTQPYTFVKNDEFVGIDIDIIKLFCQKYSYNLLINSYDYAGLIQSVKSGKADIGASAIAITDERKEAVNFTNTYCTDGCYAVIRSTKMNESIIDTLQNSFYKNFIKEDRWKLIFDGVLSTLRISIFSVIFGTIFGFIFYLISRNGNRIINNIFDSLANLLDGLPMVVILMILYYVIFASSSFSAEIVSIIAFSLTLSLGVYSMLKTAVKSIDIGQNEASFSLGFSDMQTFFLIVLPQALTQFMPNFKSTVINLVKGTAVVGYIAVQDLTKASDMIRSRTYEAFFPLISTAIIYFLLGKLLIILINSISIRIEPQSRDKQKILRKFKK